MCPLIQKPISLALMDRCQLTLKGLSCFIGTLSVPSEITLQEASMAAVCERLMYQPADVLITELNGLNETISQGRNMLLSLCAQIPTLRVIVYSRCQNGEELRRLLNVHNISMISRRDDLLLVSAFFNRVFSGERILSPLINSYLVRDEAENVSGLSNLTRSEVDVLTLLFSGMSLREIAGQQHRSIKTISAHKCNAMRKLQVKNDSELFSLKNVLFRHLHAMNGW